MKKINFQVLMALSMCFFSSVFAQDTTTIPNATANETEKDCTKELLLSYFPQNFVKETLKKFNVPEDKWNTIAQSLSDRNKDIVKLVEDKAAQQNPNPLKDPSLHQQAVTIFRDTLLQVFSDIVKANGVSDDDQIKKMFIDIQQQKAKRFVECRRQAEAAAGGVSSTNASGVGAAVSNDKDDDNDNDDEDDEDDYDDKEQEKDGADEEDADNTVKFPKPRTPRYPEERNQISQGDRQDNWNNQQNNWNNQQNGNGQNQNHNNQYQQNQQNQQPTNGYYYYPQ